MKSLVENRQPTTTSILALIVAIILLPSEVSAQKSKSKIDYSIKSNILNPDTLKKGTNEYEIFWHFVKWTHKEVKAIKPIKLKTELEKLKITTKDKEFDSAYSFFKNEIVYHKKSVENWERVC